MLIKNAIKKLEKAGYKVEDTRGHFRAVNGRFVVNFHRNGNSDSACSFGSTRTNAGPYDNAMFGWSSLASIIKAHADSMAADKPCSHCGNPAGPDGLGDHVCPPNVADYPEPNTTGRSVF